MTRQIVLAGGGIGGLAAALACTRAGWPVQLLERAPAFAEAGAGVQMGPNVTRLLRGWGLEPALRQVAAFPDALQVRSAASGAALGCLPLGDAMQVRYGAPYATLHRADLHQLLLSAVQQSGVQLHLGQSLANFSQTANGVQVQVKTAEGLALEGQALIGADGLWSRVRQLLLNDGAPRPTGHLAYRALVAQAQLPERLRSQQVTVWLGPNLHVVQYPVRGGQWLNVVAIVHGAVPDAGRLEDWDHSTHARGLRATLAGSCSPLQDLVAAVADWRLWVLCDRPPMQGAHQHASGLVALLGDAAHPMRPYLAQGAGMAIEDAACLQQVLALPDMAMAQQLQHFAQQRWQRNARVQARALRNGQIFHAGGPVRWGRDMAMRLLGQRLLDLPWLYRGPVA